MIEVNSVLFMGLWELVLLLLAVDVVIVVRFVIRRRREKASIERLVALVRQDVERRQQETRNLLEKNMVIVMKSWKKPPGRLSVKRNVFIRPWLTFLLHVIM